MRILAIDHGTRRVGLAISDELKILAHLLEPLPAEPLSELISSLKKLVTEKQVELILIGMPRNMDGTYGPAAEKVREFISALQPEVSVPIQPRDERLTTVQAHRMLAQGGSKSRDRKERIDGSAAAIILQSHLDTLS